MIWFYLYIWHWLYFHLQVRTIAFIKTTKNFVFVNHLFGINRLVQPVPLVTLQNLILCNKRSTILEWFSEESLKQVKTNGICIFENSSWSIFWWKLTQCHKSYEFRIFSKTIHPHLIKIVKSWKARSLYFHISFWGRCGGKGEEDKANPVLSSKYQIWQEHFFILGHSFIQTNTS